MFTGIIQDIGRISKIKTIGSEKRFFVELGSLINKKLEIGESIAINGACHTLESLEGNIGVFFSSTETLNKTNLQFAKQNDLVNLELSLTPSSRMGGHFVSGHIDGMAKLIDYKKNNTSYTLKIETAQYFQKYIIKKGSICLNGISLTVAEIQENIVSIVIIPHTWLNTNLQYLKIGSLINIELDMLAKYTEKLIAFQ